MKHKPEDGDAPVGVCADCGAECEAVLRDFGYGAYAFNKKRGYDEDWQWVSPCCEAEVIDPETEDDDE